MTKRELKSSIIENIEEINDENLLITLKTILENYKREPLNISEERKKILEYARQQVIDKQFVTDKDLNKEEDEWLKV